MSSGVFLGVVYGPDVAPVAIQGDPLETWTNRGHIKLEPPEDHPKFDWRDPNKI